MIESVEEAEAEAAQLRNEAATLKGELKQAEEDRDSYWWKFDE